MTTGRFLISTTDWLLVGVVCTQSDFSIFSLARSTHAPTNFSPLAQVICPPIVTMSPSLGVVFVGREVDSDEDGAWVTVSVTRTVCVGCGASGVCEGRSVAVTVTVAGAGFASRLGEPQPEASSATTPIKLAGTRRKMLPIFPLMVSGDLRIMVIPFLWLIIL